MTDETTLLHCPFCGGEAEIIETEDSWNLRIEHEQTCFFATQVCGEWTKAEAIAAWNTRAAGSLTAEQVRETVEKHWHDLSADYDMPEATALPEYSYDWQAIADDLNELGNGTCKPVETETLENVAAHVMECDKCGGTYEHVNGDYGWCPHCGAKVVER